MHCGHSRHIQIINKESLANQQRKEFGGIKCSKFYLIIKDKVLDEPSLANSSNLSHSKLSLVSDIFKDRIMTILNLLDIKNYRLIHLLILILITQHKYYVLNLQAENTAMKIFSYSANM